jgi:lysophospholipase L1-like esterase
MLSRVFFLLLLVSMVAPGVSHALSIGAFGDSITCAVCNDGSYIPLLDDYLDPNPVVYDGGISSDITDSVLSRLDLWLDSNSPDVVIVLAGTPDTYQTVGGFNNVAYDEALTVGNVESMIDLVLATGSSFLLVAPPPVVYPGGSPDVLTCAAIDGRLDSLSLAYAVLAATKSVPFVDLYQIFTDNPPIADLLRGDGLHPMFTTGDDLIAQNIATALLTIPEPSTALLLAGGLCALALRRKSLKDA